VQKETEGVGGDYGQHEREAVGMTTGDFTKSIMRRRGAEAETEVIVS
jgi:hypothetical protein